MRKLLIILIIPGVLAAGAEAGFGDIVTSFPVPGGVPMGNECHGLASDGTYLWLCGEPDVYMYKISTTGSLLSSFRLSPVSYSYFRGATYDGEYLWVVEYDGDYGSLGRFTTTGSAMGGFTPPANLCSNAGLAWESPYIWYGRHKFTTSGSWVASFAPPPVGLREDLSYEGYHLWSGGANNYTYQMTTTGSITASFPGFAARGLTFDGSYLWLVDYHYPQRYFYQIDIDVVGTDPASFGKIKSLYK